ncbi:hypothetical protein SAMN05660964_01112 [Thiothrix caldifontis]|uniref:Probable inorganic carbon transporter subunit DabA n=1 Tax=Thiothrix caldifontis TaxID=525918 RepID=A0A1H3ZAL0_9GAMM|nr:DUF2309 domain-containing protein [Thiothrix caldifontis]SEA20720.1 hypothetical protein SAMN05660964_01112 [Thiothrix caldifontis]
MNNFLGMKLKIRSMIHMAAEPIPFFWPMRTFIHHNPLHGLEHLPFAEAVAQGSKLFHGRGYLPRSTYQGYLAQGKLDTGVLQAELAAFLNGRDAVAGLDVHGWLLALLTQTRELPQPTFRLAEAADIHALLQGKEPVATPGIGMERLTTHLRQHLLADCPVYEAVDVLYGTQLGEELDTLLIKTCLDFFDEGQSAWGMPGREQGFFQAWRELALHNPPLLQRTRQVRRILAEADTAEGIIAYVLAQLGIPEAQWMAYFTRELARLHGWVGFIRWRSGAKRYYWNQQYPGDLIDFMAIRLTLALALLHSGKLQRRLNNRTALEKMIAERPQETWLRLELHSRQILPVMAHTVERTLSRGKAAEMEAVFATYTRQKRHHEAHQQAAQLQELAQRAGDTARLTSLTLAELQTLLDTLSVCAQHEGMMWLRAMEATAIQHLLGSLSLPAPANDRKRPFAQALFCIDTRSERIRRHLESVGDYQTFGIAGFFGVPVSFMELGKGSELHLCPVILTPQNLVLEMAATGIQDDPAMTALEKAVHELKASVLTPFVTVEAIGLLFGFDMIGKTLAPKGYHNWRKHLHGGHPQTHLLLDKLSRTQADSIIRAAQRAVIVKALELEFKLTPETVTDAAIRELREAALDNASALTECLQHLGLGEGFIKRLQTDYRINTPFAQWQLERLGRIGFTLDEQTHYVTTALRAIGLTDNFSRFVLLAGHGSTSANNPYESALDCGACGGNHGLVSAKVLAQMANKPPVRRRLQEQGISIPDDTWFLPALHNTTTDEVQLLDLERVPATHLMYLDRLRKRLTAASRLCAQERIPTLSLDSHACCKPAAAAACAQRNAVDWSQVRPEWGLSRNAWFVIGRRGLTSAASLDGRAFLHSYDYRVDPRQRLLENILTGPLVVGQWINMEHYFSTVDNQRFGSGSKVNHNVAGRFGVMTGNISDLRTGLPAQTVMKNGKPYHEPIRLIALIEAPFAHAQQAVERVISVKRLAKNAWIRLLVVDPETHTVHLFGDGGWHVHQQLATTEPTRLEEALA